MADQCSQHYIAHEETLKRHTDELKLLSGVPQDLKSIFEILKDIKGNSISKEVVELKLQNMELKQQSTESRIKLWVILTIISSLSSGLLLFANIYQLVVK